MDFLAFYQPGSFGALGGQIAFIAPVIGNELTTREELLKNEADHPRAREEYFKVQLGSLVRLPEPIRAERWRRFSFFYTTGEYLLRARTIAELVVRGEDRRIVWNALRERAVQCRASGTAMPLKHGLKNPGQMCWMKSWP